MQYSAAKVVLRRPRDNAILLISRVFNGQRGFEVAGGRVKIDFKNKISETLEQCATREIKEELGLEIKLIDYVGSYYFFWSSEADTISHCVLFWGDIVSGEVTTFVDGCGHELKPEWVTLEDMKAKRIPIRSTHVGLPNLLAKAADKIRSYRQELQLAASLG